MSSHRYTGRSAAGLALVLAVLTGAFAPPSTAQVPDLERLDIVERSVPDGPIAMVRGEAVSRQSFLGFYRSELTGLAIETQSAQIPDSDRVKIGLRCLARLVQRELLRQEGERRKLAPDTATVEEAFREELDELRQRTSRMEGRALTEDEALAYAGTDRGEMREAVRLSLMVDMAFRAVAKEQGMTVSDAEVRQFYQERPEYFERPAGVHLKQIYIRPKPTAQAASEEQWEAARARAQKALARIRAGENFETVARDVSDAPDRERGGDMGLMAIEQLPAVYQQAVAQLREGGMSDVLRSEFGLHIVMLVEKSGGERVTFEEAAPRIRRLIERTKAEEAVANWTAPILDDPKQVKVFLSLEDTIAARGARGRS